MSNGFVHSVKVPRLYKTAASIVRSVREDGGSLKSLIYEKKHPNVSAIYALTLNTLQRGSQLDYLIRKTRILFNEPRLDPWLARVLITELIWGKQSLKTDCKPVQTILAYEKQFREELQNINDAEIAEPCKKTVRKPRYVRINTLFLPVKEAISAFKSEGWTLLPRCADYTSHLEAVKNLSEPNFIQDFHVPELLVFPSEITFHNHAAYQSGEIVLQDKASCLPAFLLNPKPGSVVLDTCAAPGMKTSHLAAIMKNQGKIYAIEIDPRRYTTLCEQVEKTNSICVKTISTDALTLDENQCPGVEYILVDPSCSGSGMVDRQLLGTAEEKCAPGRLVSLQAFQVFLLRHALLNFPTVKKVIYSTCSINAKENEEVIDEILNDIKGAYNLVSAKDLFGKDWINYSSTDYNCSDKCLYAKPEDDLCNGFFVAIFERNFDVPLPEYKRRGNNSVENKQSTETEETVENTEEEAKKNSRKRKKRGKKKHKSEDAPDDSEAMQTEDDPKIRLVEENNEVESLQQPDEPPKKKKKKSKRKEEENEVEITANVPEKEAEIQDEGTGQVDEVVTKKKKKKKRKEKNDD